MTIGIYKLNFYDTDKLYIGQSVNIEQRILAHKSSFRKNKASPKLQKACNDYGYKDYNILLECTPQELDPLEKEAIQIFNSINNGFNILNGASVPCNYGIHNVNAQYDEETYYNILILLGQTDPSITARRISELLGVSLYVVRHIAALESHTWLEERYPEEYRKVVERKSIKHNFGIHHKKLLGPDGCIYEVKNVSDFARNHGLLQPKVSDVLNGRRNHHKGWTLAS